MPNNVITKVQVRYYDECRDQLLATRDLAPLPAATRAASPRPAAGRSGASRAQATHGRRPEPLVRPHRPELRRLRAGRTCPSASRCGSRAATRSTSTRPARSSLNASFADCFSRLSQIRVWNDGNPDNQVRIGDVHLTGGCGNTDAYFGTLPVGATDCRFGANVYVNWGDRDQPPNNVPANFTVTVNGAAATLSGSLNGQTGGYSLYTVPSARSPRIPAPTT